MNVLGSFFMPEQELLENPSDNLNSAESAPAQTAYEVLGIRNDASWEEIESAFKSFKASYQARSARDLDRNVISVQDQPSFFDFASKYRAYQELYDQYIERGEYIAGAISLPNLLKRLHLLEEYAQSFLKNKEGITISVAGVIQYLEQAERLAANSPNEKVKPEYLELIPTDFNMRSLAERELEALQVELRALEIEEDLQIIHMRLRKLVDHGYDFLLKIDLLTEQKYKVDMKKELRIVEEELAKKTSTSAQESSKSLVDQVPESRPVLRRAVAAAQTRISTEYSFGPPHRKTVPLDNE